MKSQPSPLPEDFDASGYHFAIVVSRFNGFITDVLLGGAKNTLAKHGVNVEAITVVRCPGAMEIPLVAKKLAQSGSYHAVICVGAVIRGETYHFELVADSAASGMLQASMETGIPITCGVIACDTTQQALERAGGKAGNKGAEAALAALEMVSLLERL